MTREALLIASIKAAPGDNLARLVYADYLDETGRPELAEFIRAQIRIALYAPRRGAAWRELLRRERELFWLVCESEPWRGMVWGYKDVSSVFLIRTSRGLVFKQGEDGSTRGAVCSEFSRGFVVEASARLAEFWGQIPCRCKRLGKRPEFCYECHNRRWIFGPSPAVVDLVARNPVESVVVTDRQPAVHSPSRPAGTRPVGMPFWYGFDLLSTSSASSRHWVPVKLVEAMPFDPAIQPPPSEYGSSPVRYYRDTDEAVSALSASVLKLAGEA